MSLIARLRGVPSYLKFRTLALFAADTLEQKDAEIARLRSQLVSGFYENEVPSFQQGAPTHELQDIVTAEEVTGYIAKIVELKAEVAELRELLDEEGCPRKYVQQGGITRCLYGTSSISAYTVIEAALDKEQIERIRTGHAMGAQLQAAYQWSESQTRELLATQAREVEMREHLRYYRQRHDGVDNMDPFPTDTSALDARPAEEQEKRAATEDRNEVDQLRHAEHEKELAASQAREAKLREALELIANCIGGVCSNGFGVIVTANKAVSIDHSVSVSLKRHNQGEINEN